MPISNIAGKMKSEVTRTASTVAGIEETQLHSTLIPANGLMETLTQKDKDMVISRKLIILINRLVLCMKQFG